MVNASKTLRCPNRPVRRFSALPAGGPEWHARSGTATASLTPMSPGERSRKGGLARTTPDYHIRKLTELAPALTEDQRQRLAALAAGDAA